MVLACSLAVAGEPRISVSYSRFTLPNGLDVILHEDHTVPLVVVNLCYHVGSADEKPGRTGFAHLFEHIMFMGSKDVPVGKFDQWLEAAGGDNNANTTDDRTDYFEDVPSNALALPLFLESDRMGFLLDSMTEAKVNAQRDVVKNERRETYENVPYGLAPILIDENLYPPDHPYHWPTIGSMADLSAASYNDVVQFFRTYYVPGNARAAVEYWFSDVRSGAPVPIQPVPVAHLTSEKRVVHEDRVELPRLYMVWNTPAEFAPGDAELDLLASVLAGGKTSRLYTRLVYDLQIAQDVSAAQVSARLGSEFWIVVTARSGHTLTEIAHVVQEELSRIKNDPPSHRELERAVNQYEASFLDRLESIGTTANLLNTYVRLTGNPDYFNEDLSRYRALDPCDVQAIARSWLRDDARVVLSVVPNGKKELAVTNETH
jgi:zinc protease